MGPLIMIHMFIINAKHIQAKPYRTSRSLTRGFFIDEKTIGVQEMRGLVGILHPIIKKIP